MPVTTWGSILAQRFYLFYPERDARTLLLDAAYNLPEPFDIEVLLEKAEKQFGRTLLAYWQPFTAPDCPETFAGARGEPMGGITRSR